MPDTDRPDANRQQSAETPEQQQQTMRQLQRHFHDAVGARTDAAVEDITTRWQSVKAALNEHIARLTTQMRQAQARGDTITTAWLAQARRLDELKSAAMGNIDQFANEASAIVGDAMYDALDLGQQTAQTLLAASVPPGVAYTFGVPPSDVLDAAAGGLQPGGALANLFDSFGSDVSQLLQQALFTSIALGDSAEQTAQRLEWASNLAPQRAMTIARTEIHRTWRGAQMANYRANSDVVQGWMWSCDFSPRSCFPAGKRIQTRRGLIPIEQVRVGDETLTHAGRYRPVTETLRRDYTGALVTLTADGREVMSTSDHPFLVEWQGQLNWVEAGWLPLGTRVVCQIERGARAEAPAATTRPGIRDGKGCVAFNAHLFHTTIITQSVTHIQNSITVYNLEVADDHSYVAEGFVVHNCEACLALDGSVHTLDEDFDDHICGRCSALPITLPWSHILSDAGMSQQQISALGIDETTGGMAWVHTRESGAQWFGRQSVEMQNRIMGPAKAQAWRAGDVTFAEMVGYNHSETWGTSIYAKSLKEIGLDAPSYLAAARANETDSVRHATVTPDTTVAPLSPAQFAAQWPERQAAIDAALAGQAPGLHEDDATRAAGLNQSAWEQARDAAIARAEAAGQSGAAVRSAWDDQREAAIRRALGLPEPPPASSTEASSEEGFALKEPPTGQAGAALTRDALADKSMTELRQMASDLGVKPARTKAETIDRILAQQPKPAAAVTAPGNAPGAVVAEVTPAEARVAQLRNQIDDRVAQREALYDQQGQLLRQKDNLVNEQNYAERNIKEGHPDYNLVHARYQAEVDLYHQRLDTSDPEVKQYLKDVAAQQKALTQQAEAKADQDQAERAMVRLEGQGQKGSAAWTQAKADYEAAGVKAEKAEKAAERARQNFWKKSPSVYKPELDSIGGADATLSASGAARYGGQSRLMREMGLTPLTDAEINAHPAMVAARERLANLPNLIAAAEKQIKALEKPIAQINRQIEKDMTALREMSATLRTGADALDTMRPFSDVIDLPEGTQPPNALMKKLDFRMHEPRAVTKSRIIDNIAKRLKNNPDWQEYVARAPRPHLGGVYHFYIPEYASAADTKSAQHVADWIKMWGVGYRPGSPQWVAMQMAVRDEFGLDAAIHTAAANAPAGERFYAENGAAVRALMRAMYDNTQQWFAENGITEVEVYRGFGWKESQADLVPRGINWGPAESPNVGVGELELNPFQSFSADINISQGTQGAAAAAGFMGGGFGGGSDYGLLIGARVPVDRILATAQTGFGAKLESEIVVMGRATDTVSYRAGTSVESVLIRPAEEQQVSASELRYQGDNGRTVSVVANGDGTYTVTLLEGRPLESQGYKQTGKGATGWQKVGIDLKTGKSKTYKTVEGVQKLLRNAGFSNAYTPPVIEELAVRESEGALTGEATTAASAAEHARVDSVPAAATTVADVQDWMQQQLPHPAARVDLMPLDTQTARLVANTVGNLLPELPGVAAHIESIAAQEVRSGALAYVTPDGSALVLNAQRWSDLAGLDERATTYAQSGWWVAQTPEQILGHEIGHMLQLNYHISDDTWAAALERVAAAGGNPLVSQYAGDKIEESFAETFTLLVYGQPNAAQMPIVLEMATLLRDNGLDYGALRAAVGAPPLALSAR